MIAVSSPSMAVNDTRAVGPYRMDTNKTVGPTTTIRQIVNLIRDAASTAPGQRLSNLILTAHGTPGYFELGTGLGPTTMSPFGDVQGKVTKIWFRGCLVGRIAGPETGGHGDGAALRAYGVNFGNGHEFLSAFAILTGCYVVAPTEMQARNRATYPSGVMDSYEGLVVCYNPAGVISWRHRYPSLYDHNTAAMTARTPNDE